MEKGRAERATRRALVIFDNWNRVTGCFTEYTSYYSEVEGIIEDAVHCGIQEALGIYKELESESGEDTINEN